jgi:hypothetical protein
MSSQATIMWPAVFLAASLLQLVSAAGDCWVQQGFSSYPDSHLYSKGDASKDFPGTIGPFKMLQDGDAPSQPLTKIDGAAIRGSFPKGARESSAV